MKVTIYPQLMNHGNIRMNPYIHDFVNSLKQAGACIGNSPHKNPLFSLLPQKTDSDVYIFHWLENVPDYKYGVLQTMAAIWLLLRIKLKHKKIVWFLHNRQPHTTKNKFAKNRLMHLLMNKADLIVTHATAGKEIIGQKKSKAISRTIFLHHPTKNRIATTPATISPDTDLLIWGNISRYKGVLEFVRYAGQKELPLKIKVIGKCSSSDLSEELKRYANKHIVIEDRSIPFDELEHEIRAAKFVLIPYAAETILSSGVLMDSLSFGAKVIGPNVGSFRDYAHEPLLKVYTFDTFDDIPAIVQNNHDEADLKSYRYFLEANNWERFGQAFYHKLQLIIKQ